MSAERGSTHPLVGKTIGGYVVEAVLGSGGMGVVYGCADRHLKRQVAIKALRPEMLANKEARQRFDQEAVHAAAIEHDNVVRIYNVEVDDEGQVLLVMELIDGQDLSEVLESAKGPLDQQRALNIFADACKALSAVHAHGLVHRDVKPANIILRDLGGGKERAVLTDFGIAKAIDSQTALTYGLIGTPDYMAPEVVDWQHATDLSDQYSLACVLYRMLAGERLFEGMPMPAAHKEEPLPNLDETIPQVPRNVRAALSRALHKDPAKRFPSIEAFAEAVLEAEGKEEPSATPEPLQKAMERALADRGPLPPDDLAERVNRLRGPLAPAVTGLQVEGRARLFSQLFKRRDDGRIEIRQQRALGS